MTSLTCLFQPFLPSPLRSEREAGMNMSPVSRLKKTWAKVKTAKFDVLEVRGVGALKVRFFCVSFALDQGVPLGKKARLSVQTQGREGSGLAEGRRDGVVARPFRRQRVHLGANRLKK